MSMFAMSQQHPYAYSVQQAAPARQYSTHGTSSAFSSSAHPDEDWTKISDLAERRRIQNRIAQRNYRKKLKRRLEDLERRAGSSDEAEPEKSQSPSPGKTTKRQSISKPQRPQQISAPAPMSMKAIPQSKFTPPMDTSDELVFASYNERDRSHSPPVFTYAPYPAPDELLLDPYCSAQAYPAMSAADSYPNYLASNMATGLPPMPHFSEVKREVFPHDDGMNPYMNYSFVGGVDIGVPSSYDPSNAHTPPLSHSYDHSASGSESSYEYPATPLSIPGSPNMTQHHHM